MDRIYKTSDTVEEKRGNGGRVKGSKESQWEVPAWAPGTESPIHSEHVRFQQTENWAKTKHWLIFRLLASLTLKSMWASSCELPDISFLGADKGSLSGKSHPKPLGLLLLRGLTGSPSRPPPSPSVLDIPLGAASASRCTYQYFQRNCHQWVGSFWLLLASNCYTNLVWPKDKTESSCFVVAQSIKRDASTTDKTQEPDSIFFLELGVRKLEESGSGQ